jgi:hypothetical protein
MVMIGMVAGVWAAPLKVGDVVLHQDFEGADAVQGWGPPIAVEPGFQGGHAMAFANSAQPGVPMIANFALDPVPLRGYLLRLSCKVKAENVSAKPQPWNGIKFMLPMVADGAKMYPQAEIGVGSFDWREFAFDVRVPPMVTDVRLYMGLEAVTGKVWFDDLTITVRKAPFVPAPAVTSGKMYTGHQVPRLRGAMISPGIDEAGLRTFGQEWNANVIRWQLIGWDPKGKPTGAAGLAAWDEWLQGELKKLDAALPLCRKYGLQVVVDLHSPPAGAGDPGPSMFNSPECQAKFIEAWQRMARKYRGEKVVWGYDLVNEPIDNGTAEGCLYWQELAEKTAAAVRAIDPEHAIIVECADGDNPYGFAAFNPIKVAGVVYSVHMYLPHTFTHQGVFDDWATKWMYPGVIDGVQWDKAQIERALAPVIDFQKRYHVQIYVGEFSAIRWAPKGSAARYLRDCIEVFEEHGWDWSYHAFREWSGWSVEHGEDRGDGEAAKVETERAKLLKGWYAKNEKERW